MILEYSRIFKETFKVSIPLVVINVIKFELIICLLFINSNTNQIGKIDTVFLCLDSRLMRICACCTWKGSRGIPLFGYLFRDCRMHLQIKSGKKRTEEYYCCGLRASRNEGILGAFHYSSPIYVAIST